MKKNKARLFILCLIIGILVLSNVVVAYASVHTETLKATYRDIKIYVNGKRIGYTASNGAYSEPFIVNGTTYIPLRLFSESIGMDVTWDANTSSITIGKPGQQNKEYTNGETWTVPGQWELTIDSVRVTSERNEFHEKNYPAVVRIIYHYKNLGYSLNGDQNLILYLDGYECSIVDANGIVGSSYPLVVDSPKYTPIGATCYAGQGFGLTTDASPAILRVRVTGSGYTTQEATFVLKIENY